MENHNNNNNVEDDGGLVEEIVENFDSLTFLRIKSQSHKFDMPPVDARIYKIDTPSLFYFHLSESYRDLVGLEREMKDYYDENPEGKYPKEKEEPVQPFEFYGFYSKAKKRWVRVLKDSFHDGPNGFTVALIDYAEREFVSKEKLLRYLPEQFCNLRAQGYQCQLYLEDSEMDKEWSESETCNFREKVLHRTVGITAVGSSNDHPYMPELSAFIQINEPSGYSYYLGGIFPDGTETLPPQKANIEVTRIRNNIWSKKCL